MAAGSAGNQTLLIGLSGGDPMVLGAVKQAARSQNSPLTAALSHSHHQELLLEVKSLLT
jgi:hypothetical protein